jgi:ubiquinone/menaquinone biosynthesis C-methylase UbiE
VGDARPGLGDRAGVSVPGVGGHQFLADRQAGAQPGDTVLELAAGTGETGFLAAELVGEQGMVISTDFSPGMVDSARSAGAERALRNLDYRVVDAEHMDLGDDSVDGVICRFGYMLMADPGAALAETRRVLRPGGRLVFAVWGPPDRNPWVSQLGMLAMQRGLMPPPQPGMPGIFALADPDRIRALVTGAGFDEPQIAELDLEWTFESFDDYFDFAARSAGPVAIAMRELSDVERAEMREALRERMSQFETDDGFTVPRLALNVVAQ